MRLEIAERLCCPRGHAPTSLVVVASAVEDRDLRRGVAGCPVCQLEAIVQDGDVWFDDAWRAPRPVEPSRVAGDAAEETAAIERLLALLGLAEPGGAVLLTGGYARFSALLALASGASIVVMHAAQVASRGVGVAAVYGERARVPFADGSFRAVALESGLPESFIADAVRALDLRGRILGASSLDVPAGVRELARDAREWVGERAPLAPVVQLGRGGKP